MNMHFFCAAIVMAIFALCQYSHAKAEDDPEQAGEIDLEGVWEIVSKEVNGQTEDNLNGYLWWIENNRLCYREETDGLMSWAHWLQLGTFSVDPSTIPAEINLSRNFGVVPGRRQWKTQHGIYEIDGDLLRICIIFGQESEPESRPDAFESPEGSSASFWVFRRVSREDSDGGALTSVPPARTKRMTAARTSLIDKILNDILSTDTPTPAQIVLMGLRGSYATVHVNDNGSIEINGNIVELPNVRDRLGEVSGIVDSVDFKILFSASNVSDNQEECRAVLEAIYIPGKDVYYYTCPSQGDNLGDGEGEN